MGIKKIVAVGMAFISLLICVTGCGSTQSGQKELPKKIVVGLDDAFAPMGFRDPNTNEIVGFDIDMAKEFAKRAGMEVEFKPIDWDSKEAELKSGHIDILWNGLTIMENRADKISFSDPYLTDSQMIVVRNDSSIQSKADLNGKVLGTQQASTGDFMYEKEEYKKTIKEMKTYPDFTNAFSDLELGRVDALIVDEINAAYIMKQKPGSFRMVDTIFDKDLIGVGLRKEDEALRNKINSILADMKKDGTVDKLAEKWFGTTDMVVK